MRFSKWKRAAATLIIEAILLTSLSCATVNVRGEPSQAVKAVTFEDAKKNPKLRQLYLDSKVEEWGSECVSSVIYDPDYVRANQEFRRLVKKYGGPSWATSWPLTNKCKEGNYAHVMMIWNAIGRGEKRPIFICPAAFDAGETRLSERVPLHESIHACDFRDGIKAGDRVFAQELRDIKNGYDQRIVISVLEVRATANVLRNVPPQQWPEEEVALFRFYIQKIVVKERTSIKKWNLLREIWYEEEKLINDVVGRAKDDADDIVYLLRNTIADHLDVIEAVRKHRPGEWRKTGFDRKSKR